MAPSVPPIVVLLGTALDLPDDLVQSWWKALARAQWSEAAAWRRRLLLYQTLGDKQSFAVTVCQPQMVIKVVELLGREKLLKPDHVDLIVDAILTRMGRDGMWK